MRGIALMLFVAGLGLGCESTKTSVKPEETFAHLPSGAFVSLPKLADDLDLDYHGEREGYIELSAFPDHVMLVRDSRRAWVNRREVSMDDPCIRRGEDWRRANRSASRATSAPPSWPWRRCCCLASQS